MDDPATDEATPAAEASTDASTTSASTTGASTTDASTDASTTDASATAGGCRLQFGTPEPTEALMPPGRDPLLRGMPAISSDGQLAALPHARNVQDSAEGTPVEFSVFRIVNGRRVRTVPLATAVGDHLPTRLRDGEQLPL